MPRRAVVPAGLVLALVVALSAYVVVQAVGRPGSRCERYDAASLERMARDSGDGGPRTVVIGDSYSVGFGLERPRDSWPSRLPGQVHVAGFSGSGFVRSPCGATSYAERAAGAIAGGADLVVVEGGLNDVRYSDGQITAGFDELAEVLDGQRVLVVGPAAAPERAEGARHVDDLLARLSAAHDVGYLSTIDLDLAYLDDGVHLTPAGHQAFGDAVRDAVADAL